MGSDLYNQIQKDVNDSLRSGEKLRLSVLRLLFSELKYKRIDKAADLTDAEVLQVISKAVKERLDSITQYTNGGREDLAAAEREELEILKVYQPEAMSREETIIIVENILRELSTQGVDMHDPKSFGLIMKQVTTAAKAASSKSIDMGVVSQIVKEKLH